METPAFTTAPPARRAGRFTLGQTVATGDGGRVGVGVDKNANAALVYELGHGQQGIPLHAAATALASGKVITPAAVVAAYRETGKLAALKAAITKAEKAEAPQ